MGLQQKWMAVCLVLWLAPASLALAAATDAAAEAPASEPAAETDGEALRRVPRLTLNGDVAGDLKSFRTQYEDTFAEIGNRLSLGYLELVKANPGVDPWLPGEGTTITLPRQYVMPEAPREGIVVNLAEYRLYYFRDDGVEVYPVGVGTEENPSPLTNATVKMSLESPAWYPPASIRAEYEASGDYLPRMIPPGPDNPLGPYALLLSEAGYLIHGTNKRFGVGMQVSHGCFRMYNEDISFLANQVAKGTSVRIIHQPVKVGVNGDEIWLEVHRPKEKYHEADREQLWQAVSARLEQLRETMPNVEIQRQAVESAVDQGDGIPRLIGERLTRLALDDRSGEAGVDPAAGDTPPRSPQLWF
ncbi:MAG: L,D-transpeptidase family protein [Marinobacter sp.]|uniref:L,D-transpeptidase family protein n=1 Tax=Marinobacter sp. TaxID=50741 RepID=UPI00299DCB0D|nr:L,D-transpeptidase family protein [Marinobacter sp.]MDX1756320.1 L,D-transpeptidase family protein [Marinobacter sp.]